MEILPAKHVRLSETALGLGACILNLLSSPKTVDALWLEIRELKTKRKVLPEKVALEDVVLTIDLLYLMRAVEMDAVGELRRCA